MGAERISLRMTQKLLRFSSGCAGTVAALAAAIIAAVSPALAQGNDQQQFANETINESVNTTTLFASQDIFATGQFAKFRPGEPDTRYTTMRTPFEVKLGDSAGSWQPYAYGSGALLHVSSGTAMPPGAEGQDDFSSTKLFALATGVGTYYQVSDEFKLAAAASLAFSHLTNHYDFNNSYSQQVLQPDSALYYNWDMNLFTYTPTVRAIYETRSERGTIFNYTLGYTQLFNDSIASSSPAIDIDSSTGLLWNRIAYTEPTGLELYEVPSAVRPFFQWSNISGEAARGLDLVNLYEVGADVVFSFKEKLLVLSQMHWGASYVTGDNFEGYHLGLGGKF